VRQVERVAKPAESSSDLAGFCHSRAGSGDGEAGVANDHRIDDLARSLATAAARRDVLRMILGAVAGGVAATAVKADAAAFARTSLPITRTVPRRRPRPGRCRDYGQSCDPAGNDCCLGLACDRDSTCLCPIGSVRCGGDCVLIEIDPDNCGGCGIACPPGTRCVAGSECIA
jgi:hypothetical protein